MQTLAFQVCKGTGLYVKEKQKRLHSDNTGVRGPFECWNLRAVATGFERHSNYGSSISHAAVLEGIETVCGIPEISNGFCSNYGYGFGWSVSLSCGQEETVNGFDGLADRLPEVVH